MKKSFKKYEKAGLPGGPNELKRFTQGFIVSERGQWDYPGLPTAVPTPTGKITMKGVEDDLLGIDNLGNAQYMTPGNEYQFEGDMVYEIPQAKKGGSKKYPKKYSRSLMARNILFTKNPLFKKSKSVKNKIFDPNSPYFASGGEIISFDFDDTLSTDRGLQMAQSMPNEKYIISARAEVTPDMIERARAAGISEDRIFATGSDKAKIAKIKELGINRHIDNKQSVINKLGSAGQIFESGKALSPYSVKMESTPDTSFRKGGLLNKLPKAQWGFTGLGKKRGLTTSPFDFRSSYGQSTDFYKNPNYNLTYTTPNLFKKIDVSANPLSFTIGRPYYTDEKRLTPPQLNTKPIYSKDYFDPSLQSQYGPEYQQFLQDVSDYTDIPVSNLTSANVNQYNAAQNLAAVKPTYKKGIPLTANIEYDFLGNAFGDASTGPFSGSLTFGAGYAPESGFYGTMDSSLYGVFGRRKNNQKIKPYHYFNKGLTRQGDRAWIPRLNVFNAAVKQYPEYNDAQTQKILELYKEDIEQGTTKAQDFFADNIDQSSTERYNISLLSPELTFQVKPFEKIPGVLSLTAGLRNTLGGKDKAETTVSGQWTSRPYGNIRYSVPIEGAIDKLKDFNLPPVKKRNSYYDYVNENQQKNYTNETQSDNTFSIEGTSTNENTMQPNYDGEGVGKGPCPRGYERLCEECRCTKIKLRKSSLIDKRGIHPYIDGKYLQNGGITKLSPEEEIEFQKFYATLPENLQTDDATYDIRGYWDSEGRPESFNYDQPKESDGYYHAYSINSNTGEYLKSPVHETFQHAVDEDRKIGYRPITNVYGRNIATYNESIADPEQQSFLRNMIGAPSYIELELDDNQIEEYRKGGYIIEDISIPSLTKFVNGGEEDCPEGYMRSYNGQCVPSTMSEQVNDEEWYRNWYANRVIQDEEGQKLLNDARPKILKRAEAFPEITWYSDIGSSELGSFEPLTGEIKLNSAALDNNPFLKDEVKFHEKGHYLTSPNMKDPEADTVEEVAAHPIQQLRNYEANIVNQALKSRKNIPKRDRTYYDYLKGKGDSQPYTEEISKNLMQLRRLAGFKPDQVITEEDINNLYKKANEKGWTDPNSEFFVEPFINIMKYTKDNEQLKTLFNKIAKNEPEQVDQFQPQSARYGGALSKFIGGGYQVKDISVPSLTKAKNGRQTTGIDPAFQARAQQVANNIGVPLEDLLGIMRHESGLNPAIPNPYTGAVGLIQFMPNTARKLGTSTEALKKMSAIEQLDYVEKFYKPIAGKAKDIGDLYMFTFLPAAVGKPDNFVIGASGSSNKVFGINQNALYKQNKNFDADKKGYYTVGDVKRRISKTSGRPLIGSSDQSIPGFESSTSRTPGEKTVVKTTIIKDMQNDDWQPGKEEEQVDPRIEQLKAFTKIIEPSLQNINNIYAAAMQQKRFGGNTRMFQDGGMLIDASDEDINNYTNNGYIVEEVDEQDQLLNKPGYGAIGVSGSSPVPEYLQPSDVTWYGTPRQMVTAPEEVIYRSPITGRLQSGQYDPNANQEQLADAATNIRYADVAQGRAESTTPTEEIKLSDKVIKSGNYLKGLKSVKPIKGLARPKGEFYTKEEYEKFDKDKLAKSGYYAVKLKDGNYELLKKEDISNMILARGITPDQFSKNYKIGNSESITKDFKPVYDYAQQLQAQRVGPMIDQLIYSGKSVDQAIKALVAKGEDTYEGIKQKYGEYAKTIKKDADKIYTERLEANKKKEQANEQELKDENLVRTYLNESLEGLNDYQKQNLLNLAKQQKALYEELQSDINSPNAYRTGARDATATQAYQSSNFAQEDKFTREQKEQEANNAARNIEASVLVLKSPGLTNEERKKILSNPYKLEEILKEYNNFNAIERDNNTYFNISKDGTAEWTSPERETLKNQYQGKVTLRNGPWNNYGDGSIQMIYPEAYLMGPSGAVRAAGSGLLRGINVANKIGLNDILPAAFTKGLSLAEREALTSRLAPFTLGNILTAESAARIGTEYIPNIIEGKDVGRNIAETVVSSLPLYKPASSIGAINYGRSLFNADKYGIKAYQHPDDIKSDFKLLKAISTLTGHQDGGMVMDLSDKEIDEYRKGGWIVEEID